MPGMTEREKPGLGELLRYLSEMVEQGAENAYRTLPLV